MILAKKKWANLNVEVSFLHSAQQGNNGPGAQQPASKEGTLALSQKRTAHAQPHTSTRPSLLCALAKWRRRPIAPRPRRSRPTASPAAPSSQWPQAAPTSTTELIPQRLLPRPSSDDGAEANSPGPKRRARPPHLLPPPSAAAQQLAVVPSTDCGRTSASKPPRFTRRRHPWLAHASFGVDVGCPGSESRSDEEKTCPCREALLRCCSRPSGRARGGNSSPSPTPTTERSPPLSALF